MKLGERKSKSKKFCKCRKLAAASLAEMIVALGIVGSAIFTMLYLAAKTAKQARINQERYIGSQAAGDGISLAIAQKSELTEYVCGNGHASVGVLGEEIVPENELLTVQSGENQYKLLPLTQNAQTGVWERCLNCTEDTAYLLRGLEITRISAEDYWNVESITYWKVFGTPEEVVIETRLPDKCN